MFTFLVPFLVAETQQKHFNLGAPLAEFEEKLTPEFYNQSFIMIFIKEHKHGVFMTWV